MGLQVLQEPRPASFALHCHMLAAGQDWPNGLQVLHLSMGTPPGSTTQSTIRDLVTLPGMLELSAAPSYRMWEVMPDRI